MSRQPKPWTVADLISELQKHDPDYLVFVVNRPLQTVKLSVYGEAPIIKIGS